MISSRETLRKKGKKTQMSFNSDEAQLNMVYSWNRM